MSQRAIARVRTRAEKGRVCTYEKVYLWPHPRCWYLKPYGPTETAAAFSRHNPARLGHGTG
jgi:hypothetical protein